MEPRWVLNPVQVAIPIPYAKPDYLSIKKPVTITISLGGEDESCMNLWTIPGIIEGVLLLNTIACVHRTSQGRFAQVVVAVVLNHYCGDCHASGNLYLYVLVCIVQEHERGDQAPARRSAPAKACFNPECSEAKPEISRKGWRYPISSMDNFSNNMKLGPVEELENGISGPNSDDHLNPCEINPQQSTSEKEDPSTPPYGLAVPHASGDEPNGHIGLVGPHFRPAPPPTIAKHFYGSTLSDTNSSGESHTRNGRPRGDARGRNQLLPRYWPRITDQELQQISGDSNSVITPLFEKMLSASDAGKIGRLVLPRKCAEAYFPSISQPEGLPLKVQDAEGSEWIFQFRFWPNNNSRMYVLEGVTPCIQSMQLQAGDIVTFSRLEPEGKLVMGSRKASTAPSSDQGHDGEEASEQRPEQQLEESFEQSDAHLQGNMVKAFVLEPGPRVDDPTKEGIIDTDGEVLAKGKGTFESKHKAIMAYDRLLITVDQAIKKAMEEPSWAQAVAFDCTLLDQASFYSFDQHQISGNLDHPWRIP
ncbi:hypothetical protein ACJRO7_021542 [Eucalyptus globulus]|uniref:TF-B3 domain-containing protein n=1 Tax=Eucalyptus globulus TaxID=34317 RepID=A0ABD3KWV3_EUCGL